MRQLAERTLPGRTSSRTYICTYKGTQPAHLKGRRPTQPGRQGPLAPQPAYLKGLQCTHILIFIGRRPVGP